MVPSITRDEQVPFRVGLSVVVKAKEEKPLALEGESGLSGGSVIPLSLEQETASTAEIRISDAIRGNLNKRISYLLIS